MTLWLRRAALLGLLTSTAACVRALTEIVLVVDTDLAVPGELDRVAVTVEGPSGRSSESSALLDGPGGLSLPMTLGMTPAGAASSVSVTAIGALGGREVVRRFAHANFVEGQRRMLYVTLLRSCAQTVCPAGQTCGEQGCTDSVVSSLPAWTGSAPARLDASVASDLSPEGSPTDSTLDSGSDITDLPLMDAPSERDARPDSPVTVTDSPTERTIDALIDAGVDAAEEPRTDINADGTRSDVLSCVGSRADCDHSRANGCEVDTANDPLNCGACGRACPVRANSVAVCAAGLCAYVCAMGFGDCNTMSGDGCEASLRTLANCATCGSMCALRANSTAACSTGVCVHSCAPGFGDCDADAANGCESNFASGQLSCGGCGRSCRVANAMGRCTSGTCGITCNAGFADCDGLPANGCEADLHSVGTCGTCTAACPAPRANMVASCPATSCTYGCASGFADCDAEGANGCEVNTATNPAHCGECDSVCGTNPNATPACSMGRCANQCRPMRGDCDSDVLNGCELDVSSDASNCGACGRECSVPHSTPGCLRGLCIVESCEFGFANCDLGAANGCEIDTRANFSNCGACGNTCAAGQRCAMSRCVTI